MGSCTFIGHKDTPREVEPILKSVLKKLISKNNVNIFYVGTHGSFDYITLKVLKRLKNEFPHIDFFEVLAYPPFKKDEYKDYTHTIYPDIEKSPAKYAIIERNKWMIEKSDFLICYVQHNFSNAHKFKEFAEKKGKTVLNLYPISKI